MLISEYIESIRGDFQNLAALGGAETAPIIERIGAALEPAFQKHFLSALNDLVQEFNVSDPAPLTLTIEGDAVQLSRLAAASAPEEAPPSPGDYSARIALRLSDELKESIEHLATDVGSSMNSWIVRTLERSVRSDPTGTPVYGRRQLRGKGRA